MGNSKSWGRFSFEMCRVWASGYDGKDHCGKKYETTSEKGLISLEKYGNLITRDILISLLLTR